mgnify:CR=1 FL=1
MLLQNSKFFPFSSPQAQYAIIAALLYPGSRIDWKICLRVISKEISEKSVRDIKTVDFKITDSGTFFKNLIPRHRRCNE